MPISCALGFHAWNGCKCIKCGQTRDESHDWKLDCEKCAECGATRQKAHVWDGCKCSGCGKTQDEEHAWNGCKCIKCEQTRDESHDWRLDCEKCAECGATRQKAHVWDGCKCTKCLKTRDKEHLWDGCKCTKCGKTRDESHDWSEDCESCTRCGKTRPNTHVWNGCVCSTCGAMRDKDHSWDGCKCTKCGKEEHYDCRFPDYRCSKCGEDTAKSLPDDIIISDAVYDDIKKQIGSKGELWLGWHNRESDIQYYLNELCNNYEFYKDVLGWDGIKYTSWLPMKTIQYYAHTYPNYVRPVREDIPDGLFGDRPRLARACRIRDIVIPVQNVFLETYRGHYVAKIACSLPPHKTWSDRHGVSLLKEQYYPRTDAKLVTFYVGIPLDGTLSITKLEVKVEKFQSYLNSLIEADIENRPPIDPLSEFRRYTR
jgi:hypothetical protein